MRAERFTVTALRPLTRDVYELRLAGDTAAITAPGQFVNVLVDGLYLRRPISVCDWANGSLTLVFRTVGQGTKRMAEAAPGDGFDLLTGLGNGYDFAGTAAPLLIGGGVGVPPLYGLCKRMVQRGLRPQVYLGFREAADVFYAEEFAARRYLAGGEGCIADDYHGHQVLQDGSCGGIALLDAGKIRILYGQHAEDGK